MWPFKAKRWGGVIRVVTLNSGEQFIEQQHTEGFWARSPIGRRSLNIYEEADQRYAEYIARQRKSVEV
jgi:hypothetical protein